MAKDPAFLFYSGDFLAGVQDLTMEERGQYITLLCLQHQKGRLSLKIIQLCCGNAAADVLHRFRQDENGLYYNERLEKEIEKRKVHTDKQRARALVGWEKRKELTQKNNDTTEDTPANAVALPLENENDIVLNNKKKRSAKKTPCNPPTENEVKEFAKSKGYNPEFIWEKMAGYIDNDMHDSQGNPILNWKLKLNQVWFKPENKSATGTTINFGFCCTKLPGWNFSLGAEHALNDLVLAHFQREQTNPNAHSRNVPDY